MQITNTVYNTFQSESGSNAHSVRDLLTKIVQVGKPVWKGSQVIEQTIKGLKFSAFISIPYAVIGTWNSVRLGEKMNVVANVSWLADSVATVISALAMSETMDVATKEAFKEVAGKLGYFSLFCGIGITIAQLRTAFKYDAGIEILNLTSDQFKETFDIEDVQQRQIHVTELGTRLKEKSFIYKMNAVSTQVTITGLAILSAAPAVASGLFLLSSAMQIGTMIAEKRSLQKISTALKVQAVVQPIITSGTIALLALPTFVFGALVKQEVI